MTNQKKPTDILREEHESVLQKLDDLEEVSNHLDKKEAVSAKLRELASFFHTDFWTHLTKEEDALFLELEKFIPREGGPVGVMLIEHEDLRKTNDKLQEAVEIYLEKSDNVATIGRIKEHGAHFIEVLRNHIAKENDILFMMADMHLDQAQVDKVIKLFDEIEKRGT